MHFVSDFFIALFTGYLAFTNFLALEMTTVFPSLGSQTIELAEVPDETDEKMSWLPSSIGKTIPDILLQSAEYQQAALSGAAGLTGASAQDPIEAIVNIFCTFTTDTYVRTTTGTGFFIDPDGVIMTNAHVAQFLLFEQTHNLGDTECLVRAGNPAAPTYHAELLYLPPAWIQENATVIHSAVPMGTGERDYALLYVASGIEDEPLPAVFPALDFDSSLLPLSTKGNTVTAAGYPAQDLIEHGASVDLIPRSATTTVSELYTFGSNYADVFSITGSVVGAEGASGGPVVNEEGEVIGIIVTRGDDAVDGLGSLRAITLSHIERTLQEETGFSLAENLSGNLPYRADIFAETMSPFLLALLQQAQ